MLFPVRQKHRNIKSVWSITFLISGHGDMPLNSDTVSDKTISNASPVGECLDVIITCLFDI